MGPIRKANAPIAALTIIAMLTLGCSRKAIVLDDQGRQHQGHIVGGDATSLHVVPGEWAVVRCHGVEPDRNPPAEATRPHYPRRVVRWRAPERIFKVTFAVSTSLTVA